MAKRLSQNRLRRLGHLLALNEKETRKALVARRVGVLRSWCRENVDIEELQPLRLAILKLLK